jgi:hypothetical protein
MFKQKVIRIGKIGGRGSGSSQPKWKMMMMRLLLNTKASNWAEVIHGVRIRTLLGNGVRALPIDRDRIVGDRINMPLVDGNGILARVGDSTPGAGGIKVQNGEDRLQARHGVRVLVVGHRSQLTQRKMSVSASLNQRKVAMNGVKEESGDQDTRYLDRKGGSKKAMLGVNLGRNQLQGRLKMRGASILTIKVVRVATQGAKEHQRGVRILSPEVVKAVIHGLKILTTEVIQVVIHGVRILTTEVVKAVMHGVKGHRHGAKILAANEVKED